MVQVKRHTRKSNGKVVPVQSHNRNDPLPPMESLRSLERQMDEWLDDIRQKNSENIGFNIVDILSKKGRVAEISDVKAELAHLKFSDERIEDAFRLLAEKGKIFYPTRTKVELV